MYPVSTWQTSHAEYQLVQCQYRPMNTVPVPDSGLRWAECKSQWLFTADLLESVAIVQHDTCRREYRLRPELGERVLPSPDTLYLKAVRSRHLVRRDVVA